MTGRRIYLAIYALLVAGGYFACYIFFSPLDAFQLISLLFVTVALTLLCFVPAFLPKPGKAYIGTRLRLYFFTILYLVIVSYFGYLFSFKYILDGSGYFLGLPLDESFYFLAETVVMAVFLVILVACSGGPKKEKELPDAEYQYPDEGAGEAPAENGQPAEGSDAGPDQEAK